jgi:hypothetical protein
VKQDRDERVSIMGFQSASATTDHAVVQYIHSYHDVRGVGAVILSDDEAGSTIAQNYNRLEAGRRVVTKDWVVRLLGVPAPSPPPVEVRPAGIQIYPCWNSFTNSPKWYTCTILLEPHSSLSKTCNKAEDDNRRHNHEDVIPNYCWK